MTEEIGKREKTQVRWLEGVASGRVSLAVAQAPPQSGGVPEIMSAPRVFSRKKWGAIAMAGVQVEIDVREIASLNARLERLGKVEKMGMLHALSAEVES